MSVVEEESMCSEGSIPKFELLGVGGSRYTHGTLEDDSAKETVRTFHGAHGVPLSQPVSSHEDWKVRSARSASLACS